MLLPRASARAAAGASLLPLLPEAWHAAGVMARRIGVALRARHGARMRVT